MAAEKSDPPRPIVVVMPAFGCADEAAHDRHSCLPSTSGATFGLQSLVGLFEQGSGAHVGAVGHDALPRVDQHAVNASRSECCGHNLAREHFAESGDVVGGARRQFADGRDAAQQFVQRFEVGAQVAVETG